MARSTTYVSGGVTQANPRSITTMPGIVGTLGWIWGAHDATSTNSFMTGDATQAYLSVPTPFDVNAFIAITHSYGGSTALELGIASPGKISFGVSPFSHAVPLSNPKK
ncbi:polymorphic toxin type 22 domain-containing protein [Burkholderia sp. BCC1998]|uniref:polymorphic toxin type 22 domain-containing protein n=1 Tax=Burkholderia sp. BCC1998 TaxID=2817447 RepID=UPI0039F0D74A